MLSITRRRLYYESFYEVIPPWNGLTLTEEFAFRPKWRCAHVALVILLKRLQEDILILEVRVHWTFA